MTGAEAAARAIAMIEKQVGGDQVAAIIIEPIQGEGGFIVPAEGFLPALADVGQRQRHRLHRRRGPVRLLPHRRMVRLRARGRRPGHHHHGQGHRRRHAARPPSPAAPSCMDAVHPGGLGGTYGGNPVACAAALGRHRDRWSEDDLDRRAPSRSSDLASAGCSALADERARASATSAAAAPCSPSSWSSRARPSRTPELTKAVAAACHEEGVIILTCGTYGNVIRLLPPLVISDELLLEGLQVLEDALLSITA